VSEGPPARYGAPLFTLDSGNPAAAARTLEVAQIGAEDLAAIDPGPPFRANGIALKLAGLGDSTAGGSVDGLGFVRFYGEMAGRVGRELAAAVDNRTARSQSAAQARILRDGISGVSLDEEAVYLVEFQRAYQATARLIGVLSDLTETTVNLLR
jgi:flagellar hook-associated protein 1 FlgK